MSYRHDPRWQAARTAYVEDRAGEEPTEAFVRRILGAVEMYTIEAETAPDRLAGIEVAA